jgi:hypothetical protein
VADYVRLRRGCFTLIINGLRDDMRMHGRARILPKEGIGSLERRLL